MHPIPCSVPGKTLRLIIHLYVYAEINEPMKDHHALAGATDFDFYGLRDTATCIIMKV